MRSNPFEDAIARVRDRLGPLASTIVHYPTIASTNDAAAASGVEGIVIVADEQTAGRGRRGHTWFSPPGSGLYVSTVLMPGRARVDPVRATTLLTLAAGVAIAEGIEIATGLAVDLKWPNDLFVGRRKLAGILAEVQRRPVLDTREHSGASASASGGGAPRETDNVIVGYGINVAPSAYPPEIAGRATSLESELGRTIDRYQIFADTLAALARRYDDLLAGRFDAILDAWRRRAPLADGARVRWTTPAGEQAGTTEGIDDRGALLVRVGDRIERVVSGELEWET